jgi:hypothetical protein
LCIFVNIYMQHARPVLIDYPPGGLGNFIAQLRVGSVVDPDTIKKNSLSFHQRADNYDASWLAVARSDFRKRLAGPVERPVYDTVVAHSWGMAPEMARHMNNARIWNVQINDHRVPLILNRWLKAARGDVSYLSVKIRCPCIMRLKQYEVVKYINRVESWAFGKTDYQVEKVIMFDKFYGSLDLFFSQVIDINPDLDPEPIWRLFQRTQHPVLDRYQRYQDIVMAVDTGTSIKIPDQFTPLDHGLIAYMLENRFPDVNFSLPAQEHWFRDTSAINQHIETTTT